MSKTYTAAIVIAVLIVAGVAALFFIPAKTPGQEASEDPNNLPIIDPSQHGQPTYVNATPDNIQVVLPFPGAVTGKDFSVRGKARGPWFFEASFPVELLDKNGNQLAIALAEVDPPMTNWMTNDFVNFKADIVVPATFTGPAILVLHKDNPSGLPEHEALVSFEINVQY